MRQTNAKLPDDVESAPTKPADADLAGFGETNASVAMRARQAREARQESLPQPVQGKMEKAFDASFSDVRIQSNVPMQDAQAKTKGNSIQFAKGAFQPGSQAGQELIGHELAHVVQQRSGTPSVQAKGNGETNSTNSLEREADVAGARAARGESAPVVGRATGNSVQMKSGKVDFDKMPTIDGNDVADSRTLTNEVQTQFYAHGGFMGAAPELLKDSMWNKILKVMMPDVYLEVYKAIELFNGREGGSAPKAAAAFKSIIPMFENNPVMSAYGAWKTKELDKLAAEKARKEGKQEPEFKRTEALEAFEWDAFLPTDIVEKYNDALPDEKPAYAKRIAKQMIIAHGTKGQTVKETGFGMRQYDNVQDTDKTNYGGVKPRQWLDLFGRSLRLAGSGDKFDEVYGKMEDKSRVISKHKSDHLTMRGRMSAEDAIGEYKKIFGDGHLFSVILDIKSRDATPEILKAITRELNTWGVHVGGFGSFVFEEIEGVQDQKQIINGKEEASAKVVKFLHLVGSIKKKLASGDIKNGDHVMFNAASLLTHDKGKSGDELAKSYAVNEQLVSELRTIKLGHKLNIGLYVQEPDIDPKCVELIAGLANADKTTFNMGFAWGGLSNQTSGEITTEGKTAKQGFGGQDSWFVADKWKGNDAQTQKAALAVLAQNSDKALYAHIAEATGLKFPEPISDEDFIANFPVVIKDYSMWRDVSFSEIRLVVEPTTGEAKLVMNMKMLGGTKWLATVPFKVPVAN